MDRRKKAIFTLLKLGIPACIFAYLLWQVDAQDYQTFWNQRKRWDLLVLAQIVALSAIILSFLRWRILVRAFEIPFSLTETMRLGFLGYLLNFVSFGSVGGDLFKAILVARDQPDKRPEAVATVLLDRAFGLFGLVLLAWISLVACSGGSTLSPIMIGIRNAAGLIAVVASLALVVAVFGGGWFEKMIDWGSRLPVAGETLARMARALRLLRKRPSTILGIVACSLGVHFLLATTFFLISSGVYAQYPTFQQHLMVVPPGMAAGALPLAPGGIGYQEGALAGLFKQLPNLPTNFSGILVATIYRLVTIAIAGIGLIYYWTSHGREFQFAKKG